MWAAAAATYGAGDTLTTLAVVWYSAVVEANPVVAAATDLGGVPGLGAFASTTNVLLLAG